MSLQSKCQIWQESHRMLWIATLGVSAALIKVNTTVGPRAPLMEFAQAIKILRPSLAQSIYLSHKSSKTRVLVFASARLRCAWLDSQTLLSRPIMSLLILCRSIDSPRPSKLCSGARPRLYEKYNGSKVVSHRKGSKSRCWLWLPQEESLSKERCPRSTIQGTWTMT